jgi:hypothetical protein
MKSLLFIVLSVITLTSFISSKSQIIGKINTDCFGATTEAAFDEVTRYSRYKDEAGILRLMSKGKVVLLKKGTSVYFKSSGFTVTKIEVTSGSYAGLQFYVPIEQVTFSR